MFGIFFRIIFPNNFGVGFDQVQIIEKANQIISGDLSLIGPRTGPADMFTGPLIYYLTIPFVFIFGNFSSIFLTPLFISLITGLVFYWITKQYIGYKESVIATAIWSFSPFLVSLDRVFWNPNITLLSTLLIFVPLLKNKIDKKTILLVFTGSFLAYQAHFSGFFLIILGILSVILFKKSYKFIVSMISGITLSLLPTAIFDIRNNFLNFRGAINLASDKGEFNFISLISNTIHNIYILAETYGKLFLFGNNTQTIVSLGLFLLMISILIKKQNNTTRMSLFWLLSISIAYAFYGEGKPEYYFLIAVPALIFLFIDLTGLLKQNYQKLGLVFFVVSSFFINLDKAKINSGMNVGNISRISFYLADKNVENIIYDVPYGEEVGIKYFLSNIQLTSDGNKYHISYPNDLSFNGISRISNIGLWRDARKDNKNYISTKNYFLETSESYFLYKDLYPKKYIQDFDTYKIIENNSIIGTLDIAEESKDKLNWVQDCLKQKPLKNYNWVIKNNTEFYRYNSNYCMKVHQKSGYQVNINNINIK